MTLFITVTPNKTKGIQFQGNIVNVSINKLEDINALLKNKKKLKEELALNKTSMIDYSKMSKQEQRNLLESYNRHGDGNMTHEELLAENLEEKKAIENMKKCLKQPFTIESFQEIIISFKPNSIITPYLKFLEGYDQLLTIDLSGLSNEDIVTITELNYKKTPMISCQYNSVDVTLDKYLATYGILNQTKSAIEKYKLSPLEQTMFIYDLVKERVYRKLPGKQTEHTRDLSKVLFEDEIVCLGYANIFAANLNAIGIDSEVKTYYFNRNNGHAVALVYINDQKYNFNGVLEFDPTWDSRKGNEENWMNKYRWFGTCDQTPQKERLVKLKVEVTESNVNSFISSYNRYKSFCELNAPDRIIHHETRRILTLALGIYKKLRIDNKTDEIGQLLANIGEYYPTAEELDIIFVNITNYLKQKLPIETFISILYKTRRIKHSINPQKYPFNLETIQTTVTSKYQEIRLLAALFEQPTEEEIIQGLDVIQNVPEGENIIECDAKRMQLIYVLKQAIKKR